MKCDVLTVSVVSLLTFCLYLTLASAKEPFGQCPAGFQPSATTKGKYTCTSARPKCGQGYMVKGVQYDAVKKQLVYSCAQPVSATVMRPAARSPKPRGNEEPLFTVKLARGYVKSTSRRELRMKIEDPEVRDAALRAYDALSRLARAGHAQGSQQIASLNRAVDQKYDDLMLAAKNTEYQLCIGKCNNDRKKCKSDCKQQGKTLCGCGATAVMCFVGSLIPGGGC